jgi:hypothetical protein
LRRDDESSELPVPAEPAAPRDPVDPATPAGDPSGPQPAGPSLDLRPVVDQVLADARATVSADDYVLLTRQSRQVLSQRDPHEAKIHLEGFYLAAQDAAERQERRTANSREAAQLLVGLAPLLQEPATMNAHQRRLIAALREVVAERRDLDDELRAGVDTLVAPACRAAADRAKTMLLARELAELGYDVSVQSEADAPGSLVATLLSWGSTHRVEIEIQQGELDAQFISSDNAVPAETRFLKARWAEDVHRLKDRMTSFGVSSTKLLMTDDPDTVAQAGSVRGPRSIKKPVKAKEMPPPDDND